MPRRSKPKGQKRDLRWWLSMLLNGAVAVSMVLGTIFLFTGAPTPTQSLPTIAPPTVDVNAPVFTPTLPAPASTPVAPTPPPPTPKP